MKVDIVLRDQAGKIVNLRRDVDDERELGIWKRDAIAHSGSLYHYVGTQDGQATFRSKS